MVPSVTEMVPNIVHNNLKIVYPKKCISINIQNGAVFVTVHIVHRFVCFKERLLKITVITSIKA